MAKRKRRTFTPEYKTEVVLEAIRGETAQAKLCRRHNLSEEQISKWKQHFLENMDVFTRMIRGWNLGQQLTQPLTLPPL